MNTQSHRLQVFFHFAPGDKAFREIAGSAARIATLLEVPKVRSSDRMKDCLDELVGVVYCLVFATREKFEERVGKPVEDDKVLVRSKQLAEGKVRTDGKWMAGFHLNSAMFRESSAYDRILTIASGPGELQERRNKAESRYDWLAHANIRAIHGQVTELKHSPSGSYKGRRKNAGLTNSITALGELLSLIEAWTRS